jgi:hypothetical protein
MLDDSDNTQELLPGAPTMAQAPTVRETKSAWRRGKKDARSVPDRHGHHPATRSYAADVDRVEALIHAALIDEVARLDTQISRGEAELRIIGAAPAIAKPQPLDYDDADGSADARNARRVHGAASSAAIGAESMRRRKLEQLSTDVASMIARRHHVHDRAAALLQSWQARFTILASAHRAGFTHRLTRRWPRPRLILQDLGPLPEPRHEATHGWANGEQLPITMTTAIPAKTRPWRGPGSPKRKARK